MKRFEFSLNKLKDYKEQVLDREKNSLAVLRRQQQELEEEKINTINTFTNSCKEFDRKTLSGITVMQIQVYKSYHEALRLQIEEIQENIDRLEIRIQNQLRVVVERTKEVSTLDKLEDRQLEDYNYTASKTEEQFIAEYVLNSSYKK